MTQAMISAGVLAMELGSENRAMAPIASMMMLMRKKGLYLPILVRLELSMIKPWMGSSTASITRAAISRIVASSAA